MYTNNHLQQQISSSGLMRYRSAPSSFFANLVNGGDDGCDDFQYLRPSSPEFDNVFGHNSIDEKSKHEAIIESSVSEHNNDYYNSSSLRGFQNHDTDSSLGFINSSMELENSFRIKEEDGNSSNLGNHRGSPAGFFSNSPIENGFAAIRENGSFSSCNDGINGGEADRSTNRLKSYINFSSGLLSSSPRVMPQTTKIENGSLGISSSENGNLQNGNGDIDSYIPTFTIDSWDDPAFGGLKRTRDGNAKMFESQNGDEGNRASGLTRHMSLPSSSTEMAAIAKFLQFQDSAPCKIRAKRGFATHPRSIAERVRRSRISERMRKLQELFPDMDKQTNTAEMLDLAVDSIKDLQKQVKTLADTKSNCTCSSKHKGLPNATA